MAKKIFYITTPIYYVNDVPHIGHAYTTVAADVLARYWRLRGYEVFFLTGLDEHGQKVQQAAAKAGIDPQVHCDKLAPQFENLWEKLNISNDAFIRTTDAKHKEIVRHYLRQLSETKDERGDRLIYPKEYTGWYCTFDERFWTEKDVKNGLCPDCNRPVEQLSEHNYFFKMGQYQDRLIEHIKSYPDFIRPESRRNEVLGFLQTQKLGDLSISRPKSRLSWGIELPFDTNYVTYVWFDALVNYISALEYLPREKPVGEHFWPATVHLVGKDILTTHAVYWSTMLMALNRPLPETIFAHGWWTVDGEKMSKSRGNVVDPNQIVDKFGADAFRYFLLREVPFGQDGDFSESSMIARINSELANDLGNLLSRTVTLIERYAGGVTPQPTGSGSHLDEEDVKTLAIGLFNAVEDALIDLNFHRALMEIWKLIDRSNRYLEQMAPWNLAKREKDYDKLVTVLYTAREALRFIGLYLHPFMPNTAEAVYQQLGLSPVPMNALEKGSKPRAWGYEHGQAIKGAPLFPRIGNKPGAKPVTESSVTPQLTSATPAHTATPAPPSPSQITIDEFMKVQLKTAKVLSAERVPKSEKLIKLQVSVGTEQRQIVAGIGKKYEPDALVGKTIVIVANLKPAKLMGIDSQGMVLAAGDADVRGLLTVLEEVDPGTKVK